MISLPRRGLADEAAILVVPRHRVAALARARSRSFSGDWYPDMVGTFEDDEIWLLNRSDHVSLKHASSHLMADDDAGLPVFFCSHLHDGAGRKVLQPVTLGAMHILSMSVSARFTAVGGMPRDCISASSRACSAVGHRDGISDVLNLVHLLFVISITPLDFHRRPVNLHNRSCLPIPILSLSSHKLIHFPLHLNLCVLIVCSCLQV
mmetsp:Transcript_22790/g.51374  ORF Transcript_22790/g.51374 Transcript_22790/m.51374 type:complete len:206 (-) Transcript_22790:1573-2190(-)